MRSSIAVLAASVVGTLAQSTSIVSLFIGGPNDGREWVGSVVSAGPSDTVYEILCTASMCGTYSARVSPLLALILESHTNLIQLANSHHWPITLGLPIRYRDHGS
jgi:hypothetical protein